MVSTWISPKAIKGAPSEIAGRGVVAVKAISKGEVVAVKGGHIVTSEQLRSMPSGCRTLTYRSPTTCTWWP